MQLSELDYVTINAYGIINAKRKFLGVDGQALQALTYAIDPATGYVELASTTDGFVVVDTRPNGPGPVLQIVELDPMSEAILLKAKVFALNGKVLEVIGSDKIESVGNPRIWQWNVKFTSESYP